MNDSTKFRKGISVDTFNIYLDTENKTKILNMKDLEREMLKVILSD
jgi:hypothetical protein